MKITLQNTEGKKDFYLPQFIPGSATFQLLLKLQH